MTNLPKPLAVLFDWDGTLVDSFESIVAAHNAVCTHFGESAMTADQVMDAVQAGSGREVFKKLYPDAMKAQEALDIYYENIPRLRNEKLVFVPGAKALVEYLFAQNIPMGVVSNMAHGPLVAEIEHMGWTKYFKTIVGAGEAPRGKPDPAPVYLALERLGFSRWDAPDVWFVGDMMADQKAATSAGCPFVFYAAGIAPENHKRQMVAALKLTNYDELTVMAKELLETA